MKKWKSLREAAAIRIWISEIIRNPEKGAVAEYHRASSWEIPRRHEIGLAIRLDLSDPAAPRGDLQIRHYSHDIPDQHVRLSAYYPTKHWRGPPRWLFVCPISGSRTETLYLPSPGLLFASAAACGIRVYAAENLRKLDRQHHRLRSLYRRLGAQCHDSVSPPPPRPLGMHHRQYKKMVAEIYSIQEAIWSLPKRQRVCENHTLGHSA